MRVQHIGVFAWVGVTVIALSACTGCGEKPDLPDASVLQKMEGETSTQTTREPDSSASLTPPSETAAVTRNQQVETDQPDIPVRVAALISRLDGDVRVGLVGDKGGEYVLVGIGGAFMGYELMAADVTTGEVVLQREGKDYHLKLERQAMLTPPPVPGGAIPENIPLLQGSDVSGQPGSLTASGPTPITTLKPSVVYKPTQEEKERGIDPNNPSTWKPGYMGPGIERARTSAAPAKFEPTTEEEDSGINPNDPSSWPEGYRGPGIERLSKTLDDQTNTLDNQMKNLTDE